MKSAIGFIVAVLSSAAAYGNGTGTVTALAVGRSGYQVLVQLEGTVDPVGCRTRTDYQYYLDLSTTGAQAILAALLAAKASAQNIVVQSTGSCDTAGNGLEVIGYVVLQ